MEPTTIVNLQNVPLDTYRKFKALWALKGRTVTHGCIRLREEAIEKQKESD
jgi:lipoprotein-anchoring transpeptidase ErfK/SrfK